jgi:hypothetical protein
MILFFFVGSVCCHVFSVFINHHIHRFEKQITVPIFFFFFFLCVLIVYIFIAVTRRDRSIPRDYAYGENTINRCRSKYPLLSL